MKKKTILTWLTLAVVLAVSGCGGGTPAAGLPAVPAPAAEALKEVVAYTLPASTPAKEWTIPLRVAPLKEIQKYPSDKFPEGWPQGTPTPFEVGMLEIGPGASTPGQFVVAIDIDSTTDTVSGLLASTTDSNVYQVDFQRIPQVVNPERGKDAKIPAFQSLPDPPNVGVAIRADSVCFVVNTKNDPPYVRYCSVSGSLLSVRDNFKSQYTGLQKSIQEAASGVGVQANVLNLDQIISEMENPSHLQNCAEQLLNPAKAIQAPVPTSTPESMTLKFDPPADAAVPGTPKPSLAFSEGGTPAPESAALFQASCGSDITVASVTLDYYDGEIKSLPTPSGSRPFLVSLPSRPLAAGGPTPITVAVVQILQPIDTVLGTVFPGNYRLDYWFNPGNVFYAATITGTLASNNAAVTNQPVPAVPATFVNTDGSEQGGAQISTCRIFGRCTFFQSSCS